MGRAVGAGWGREGEGQRPGLIPAQASGLGNWHTLEYQGLKARTISHAMPQTCLPGFPKCTKSEMRPQPSFCPNDAGQAGYKRLYLNL
jgi:hypothetical protein